MVVAGNPSNFSDLFPDKFIPGILEYVINAWEKINRGLSEQKEVDITKKLCERVQMDKGSNEFPFKVRWEMPLVDSMRGDEGRADLFFDYIGTNREEVYFLFECKLLNVHFPSGFAPLADRYVGAEGMMCFITGKYSRGLEHGGMIGYVMDGQVDAAIAKVGKSIQRKSDGLSLRKDQGLEQSIALPSKPFVKTTFHDLDDRNFIIHHLFLEVSSS